MEKTVQSGLRPFSLNAIALFLIIALPLYPSNALMDYIKIAGTQVNIFHVLFLLGAVVAIIHFRGYIKREWLPLILLAMLYGLALVIGLVKGNQSQAIITDLNFYVFPILIFISVYFWINECKITLYSVTYFIFIAVTFCCTLNLIMYFTRGLSFWGIATYAGSRFGGSFLTAIVVATPFATARLFDKRVNTIAIIYFFAVSSYSLILSQSRSIFITSILSVFVVATVKSLKKSKLSYNGLVKWICFLIVAMLILLYFVNGRSALLERLVTIGTIKSDDSFLIRSQLYLQNLKIMFLNPFGLGMGGLLPTFDINGYFLISQGYIDNVLLTIGEKLGWLALAIYTYVVCIRPTFVLYRIRNLEDGAEELLIGYIGLIINAIILTAQSLTSMSGSAVTWLIVAGTYLWSEKINDR